MEEGREPSFIHIDDGLGFKATMGEALEAAIAYKMVRKDLNELGLITSVDKCQRNPLHKLVWILVGGVQGGSY